MWDGNKVVYDRDANGKLVHETDGTHDLFYYYDADGTVGSISYDYTRYAFRKNLQGDVIAILDTNGNPVARYAYDAWGRVLSVTDGSGNAITDRNHVANKNPIRYRGYYYDTDTGWYYLGSRYYDPVVKRFINADGVIADYNLFAYCNNNPVMRSDHSGFFSDIDIYGSHILPGTGGYQKGFREYEDYNRGENTQRPIDLDKPNNGVGVRPIGKQDTFASASTPAVDPVIDDHSSRGLSIAGTGVGYIKSGMAALPEAPSWFTPAAYVLSTPLNIASYQTNPHLTDIDKYVLSGYEVSYAAVGISVAYASANIWNPTGWAAGILGFSVGFITSRDMSRRVKQMEIQNKFFYGI